jgi:hypothetical protein
MSQLSHVRLTLRRLMAEVEIGIGRIVVGRSDSLVGEVAMGLRARIVEPALQKNVVEVLASGNWFCEKIFVRRKDPEQCHARAGFNSAKILYVSRYRNWHKRSFGSTSIYVSCGRELHIFV